MKVTIEFDKAHEDWDEFDECELKATLDASNLALALYRVKEYLRHAYECGKINDDILDGVQLEIESAGIHSIYDYIR